MMKETTDLHKRSYVLTRSERDLHSFSCDLYHIHFTYILTVGENEQDSRPSDKYCAVVMTKFYSHHKRKKSVRRIGGNVGEFALSRCIKRQIVPP